MYYVAAPILCFEKKKEHRVMKKALIITAISGFLPQFEMNDVRILQEYGFQIHYASNFKNPVYSFEPEDLEKEGIILHHVDIKKMPFFITENIKALKQIRDIIDQEKIDIVHCHNPVGAVVGRLAACHSKQKPYVIYTAHGFHFYKGAPWRNWLLYYPVEKWLAGMTDLLITINQEDYERAKKFRLKKDGRVERIHGVGVDFKRYVPKPEMYAGVRKSIGIPEEGFHIVTAAELNDNKNHKVIIRAIRELGRKDIYYSICGKGNNEKRLQRMIQNYGLEDQVRLLGYRTDMDDILQSADCFAFPSIREGLGIAAVEALATGVPLIVAENRGTREYTRNQYNGIVCQSDDVNGFKEAIEKLYTDKVYRNRLAANCRENAMHFSVEATGRIMKRIYGKVVESLGEDTMGTFASPEDAVTEVKEGTV